jgi:large subunit ribosomal protein L10
MLRKQKEAKLTQYEEAARGTSFAILLDPSKASIRVINELRNNLAERGASAVHMKNTLARIIFEREGMETACEIMVGPSLMVYGGEDIGAAAKVVRQLQKDFRDQILPVKGIWFDGKVYPGSDFRSFADLPGKNEVRAMLLGVLKEPSRRLASLLSETHGRLVRVINEHAKTA